MGIRRRQMPMTDEARESYLVSLAFDLAEKQLREGTASSQVQTQFLKAGMRREQLELDRLRNENALLQARVKNMENQDKLLELQTEAIRAMRSYQGIEEVEPYDGEE